MITVKQLMLDFSYEEAEALRWHITFELECLGTTISARDHVRGLQRVEEAFDADAIRFRDAERQHGA